MGSSILILLISTGRKSPTAIVEPFFVEPNIFGNEYAPRTRKATSV